MKLLSFSKTILFLSVFILICGCSSNADQNDSVESATNAAITSVTMTLGTSGAEMEPSNPANVFQPTDTIHAVVRIKDAPVDTKLSASWIVEDVGTSAEPGTVIDTNEITADGTRNIDFTLKPAKPFPEGKYRVEISIDGELDTTKNFSVKP